MKMKIPAVILALLLVLCCTGCTEEKKTFFTLNDGSTLETAKYANSGFHYTFEYPTGIYTEVEEGANGLKLVSDESVALVFAEENKDGLTLKDAYEKASAQYESIVEPGGVYRHSFDFVYDNGEKEGRYFCMLYFDNFYTFCVTYPPEKADYYKEIYSEMVKAYLISDPSKAS